MKPGSLAILIVSFFSINLWLNLDPSASACGFVGKDFACAKVVRVIDGDTISVDLPGVPEFFGKDQPLRLSGVDAPELHSKDECEKKQAVKARNFVEYFLKNKIVHLKNLSKDKYGRLLSDVSFDGVSVSSLLIERGFAVAYYGEAKKKIDWCKKR